MSISFDNPMNEEAKNLFQEMFKDRIAAMDTMRVLIDGDGSPYTSSQMKEIANTAKQPATLTIHDEGDIVEMSDGVKYRVGPNGWRRFV